MLKENQEKKEITFSVLEIDDLYRLPPEYSIFNQAINLFTTRDEYFWILMGYTDFIVTEENYKKLAEKIGIDPKDPQYISFSFPYKYIDEQKRISIRNIVVFNPDILSRYKLTPDMLKGIIAHEMRHIFRDDILLEQYIKDFARDYDLPETIVHNVFNLIADAFINEDIKQDLKNLPKEIAPITFDNINQHFANIFQVTTDVSSDKSFIENVSSVLSQIRKTIPKYQQKKIIDVIMQQVDLPCGKKVRDIQIVFDKKKGKFKVIPRKGDEEEINITDGLIKEILGKLKEAGAGTGNLEATVDFMKPTKNWREILHKFFRSYLYQYSYRVPRALPYLSPAEEEEIMYLPKERRVEPYLTNVVIALDVSGSISDKEYSMFISEVLDILKLVVKKVTLVQIDAIPEEDWEIIEKNPDGKIRIDVDPRTGKSKIMQWLRVRKGYGGTEFAGFFRWVKRLYPAPLVIIVFTDLDLHDWDNVKKYHPSSPVLWVVVRHSGAKVPFGEVIIATPPKA